MRKIDSIIVHCSASDFGNVEIIDGWHKENGWDCIGYHVVICNGTSGTEDGEIQYGRDISEVGAHCYGKNKRSIGICMIGNELDDFTNQQLINLSKICIEYMEKYNLTTSDIYGHYEFDPCKTCPGMDADMIRRMVELTMI